MNIIDSINNKMAMANLDIALDLLNDLLDENHIHRTDRDIEWARLCCTYSRCVHLNVWRDNTPIDIIKEQITPLLEKAEEELGRLEREYAGKEKFTSEIEYYKTNIHLREENLSENFANGKPSGFPPDAIDPDMRTRLENIARLGKNSNATKHTA